MTPNTTGKERECCEKCEYRHFEEGYLTNDCRNEKCECHSPQSTKMKNEYIWRAVLDKILCGDLEEQRVTGIMRLINDAHSTLLTELEKSIEGLRKTGDKVKPDGVIDAEIDFEGGELAGYMLASTFNQCLSQVLELINNLKKRE